MNEDALQESLSKNKIERLLKKLQRTLMLIFDERSLLAAKLFALMERNASIGAHGGNHKMEGTKMCYILPLNIF